MSDFQELEHQFGRWKAEILRLATRIPDKISKAFDAKAVNGISFSEMLQSIRDRVVGHVEQDNPHNLTVAQIDAYTKSEIDERVEQRQAKRPIAISKIPQLIATYNSSTRKLEILPATLLVDGVRIELPDTETGPVPDVPSSYVKLNVIRTDNIPTSVTFSFSTDDGESKDVVCVGVVNHLGGNDYSLNFFKTVRLGQYRISSDIHGKSIPATTGSPTASASLPGGWFGG